jgi:hypothetical protein
MSCTVSSSCCTASPVRCTASPACCAASSARCKHHQLTVQPHPPAEQRSFSSFTCSLSTVQLRLVKCPQPRLLAVQPLFFIVQFHHILVPLNLRHIYLIGFFIFGKIKKGINAEFHADFISANAA